MIRHCLRFVAALGCLVLATGLAAAATTQYTYDDLDRLVKVEYANGTVVDYTYDDAGNILSVTTTAPAAGSAPDGDGVPGTPLTVAREPDGDVTLIWGASCTATDTDYVIYAGTIGDFASHSRVVCGTGGATTKTLTPAAGSTYYLVVPRNGSNEGSRGTDGTGAERPEGTTTCLPRLVAGC